MTVLYEDNHIIIVNKTASEIVQGDKTGDTPLSEIVKQYLKEKYQKPGNVFIGVTHRLDRPVSGLVVFAKTSKALGRLNEMFRGGEVKKTYWAIVKNMPPEPEGELVHYLAKMGCPIRGDLKYGFPRSNPDGSICLHARRVRFVHPVSKELIEVVAPVPDSNLWHAFPADI